MIYKNVELFNVEEIEEKQNGMIAMRKFPKSVCREIGLGFTNKYISYMTSGVELRFTGECAITLMAWEADGYIEVYKGDYFKEKHYLKKGVMTTIFITNDYKLHEHDLNKYRSRYDQNLWRIICAHDCCIMLCDIDEITPIRPPKHEELPEKTILAYGSSITHGAGSQLMSNSYAYIMGHELGMDVINKGMGGSCFCDKCVADYIKTAKWDYALLELAVNMLHIFPVDEYEKRVKYLIGNALETGKKVVYISHFRHSRDLPDAAIKEKELNDEFQSCAAKIQKELACKNLICIDGRDIVDDYRYLTCDLIHPSVYGHHMIGHRLAQILEDKLK